MQIDRPNLGNRRSADGGFDRQLHRITGIEGKHVSHLGSDSRRSLERRFNPHNKDFCGEPVMERTRDRWRRPGSMKRKISLENCETSF